MSRLSIILALCAGWLVFASIQPAEAACTAPCTKAQATTDINADWPDNAIGAITPALLRSDVLKLLNSYLDVNGSSSFACSTHQFLTAIATLSSYTCAQPALADVSGFGTGVATALGVNVGTVGAPVVQGGDIGTPSAGVGTNLTALNASNITSGTLPAARVPTLAVTAGTIDGAVIGGVTPGAGTFTLIKLGAAYGAQLTACALGVNFNLTNTDNAISISLPTGVSSYTVSRVQIANASGSISTATAGLFTSTGGGGVTIAATQALTVTTAAANTNNNTMILTLTNPNTTAYNVAALQFRTTTPQGSAATADVCINYLAAP